jgi:uncharacterized protein (TIGR03086 family)
MGEGAERYRRVSDGFGARLRQVGAEQWSDPTPCEDWTVRQLATHVVDTQRRVLSMGTGAEAVAADPEGDLLAQWEEASAALLAAVNDPECAASEISTGMFGDMPFEGLVGGLACSDTVVHTWDLARATGQDEHLDTEAVANSAALLERVGDGMRSPGGLAPALTPPAEADAQVSFLSFCGRAV